LERIEDENDDDNEDEKTFTSTKQLFTGQIVH